MMLTTTTRRTMIGIVPLFLLYLLVVQVPVTEGFSSSVRFTLYPLSNEDINLEEDSTSKEAKYIQKVVKDSVKGIKDLGVYIQKAKDDISTYELTTIEKNEEITYPSSTVLFEAIRIAFGRASTNEKTGEEQQINMVCTFSDGMTSLMKTKKNKSLPDRTVKETLPDMVPEATTKIPDRIVAQFSFYPLGGGGSSLLNTPFYEIIQKARKLAKQSKVWKSETEHFVTTLDGDGNQVLDVIQVCFDLVADLQEKEELPFAMSCTLTANKKIWNLKP